VRRRSAAHCGRARGIALEGILLAFLAVASASDSHAQAERDSTGSQAPSDTTIKQTLPPSAPNHVDPDTWVDDDARPIEEPAEFEKNLYGHYFREGFVEPLSHALDIPDKLFWLADEMGVDTEYEAVNVNEYDEVPNSSWFTNRNHVKAVCAADVRHGLEGDLVPKPPWTIKSIKRKGVNPGFQIKDADDKRWLVKLDPPGYPQLGSGADAVSSRLLLAAGYNVPHDVALTFRREDLKLDEDLVKGKDGEPPFTEDNLNDLLARGHCSDDGRYYGQASLFLTGTPIGHINFRGKRPDDPNDLYTHRHRRELRGLYVVASWLQHWDTKDHQSLEMFVETTTDSLGYVKHYLQDLGATLGAAAEGPKRLQTGYEYRVDLKWITRRFLSLGFVVEPWRRAEQETGIPAVGNFEAAEFEPDKFTTMMSNPAFRECTDRDAYWGTKIVSSFSDAQIEAAIDAAGYEDPRVKPRLLETLIERRDKIARYWFDRVTPVDFFHVDEGRLEFHDLAVDRGLERPRPYEIKVKALDDGEVAADLIRLEGCSLDLAALGPKSKHVRLQFSLEDEDTQPTTVELLHESGSWIVSRVRHS
jgi:hypothetical protein